MAQNRNDFEKLVMGVAGLDILDPTPAVVYQAMVVVSEIVATHVDPASPLGTAMAAQLMKSAATILQPDSPRVAAQLHRSACQMEGQSES